MMKLEGWRRGGQGERREGGQKTYLRRAVFSDSHVVGGDAFNAPVFMEKNLGSREQGHQGDPAHLHPTHLHPPHLHPPTNQPINPLFNQVEIKSRLCMKIKSLQLK